MFQAVARTMYCSTTYPAKKKYSLVNSQRVSTSKATATTNETTQNLAAPIATSAPRPHHGRGRGPARRGSLFPLSAPGGGEGRGEVGEPPHSAAAPPTSPSPSPTRWVPSLSPRRRAERANPRLRARD